MQTNTTPHLPKPRSAVAPLLVVAALVIAALGGATYAFRDRLGLTPFVDRWLPGDQVAEDHAAHAAPEGGSPVAGAESAEQGAESRAPVMIDVRRQQLIGVRTALAERTELLPTFRTVGIVRPNETLLADVNLKLEGWIRDLYVDFTGQFVTAGQPLFALYSPDLLTTQNEYLLALRTRDELRQSPLADARDSADRLVDTARQRLELWDLPPDEIRAIEETRQPRTTMVFRSPASGYVIEKQAVAGMHVTPGQTLYRLADLSRIWIEADVYEQEMLLVGIGRPAVVTLDAYPGERFAGNTVYIAPHVDERTRTVRVRFEFSNADGRLRPGMYANVELQSPSGRGLTVPADAVLDSGRQQIVFVALGDGYFEPRQVTIGRRLGDRIEIREHLKAGERVAIGATFFLDSESQLRGALQGYQPLPSVAPAAPAARLDITFRSQPDPPRSGDNTFEVTVKDAEGRLISNGDVTVTFFMAAMPTMNMPAMRSEAKLAPEGNGTYRGRGQLLTPGRWDVTVAVTRGGQRLGTGQFSVSAR